MSSFSIPHHCLDRVDHHRPIQLSSTTVNCFSILFAHHLISGDEVIPEPLLETGHLDRVLRDNNEMKLHVQCYAGTIGDERPIRFRLDHREYLVEEIIDQWYGPEDIFFKVRADDSNFYILRHRTSVPEGEWELVSFRENRPA